MVVPTMETLPRVPDTHGDTVDEKLFSDLYIRTSWFDASIALDQIEKVSHMYPHFFLQFYFIFPFVFFCFQSFCSFYFIFRQLPTAACRYLH